MNAIEVEVISQHYIGTIRIEPVKKNPSLFYIHLDQGYLGRAQAFKNHGQIMWYSHEITDKELLTQIGEWIEYSFPV